MGNGERNCNSIGCRRPVCLLIMAGGRWRRHRCRRPRYPSQVNKQRLHHVTLDFTWKHSTRTSVMDASVAGGSASFRIGSAPIGYPLLPSALPVCPLFRSEKSLGSFFFFLLPAFSFFFFFFYLLKELRHLHSHFHLIQLTFIQFLFPPAIESNFHHRIGKGEEIDGRRRWVGRRGGGEGGGGR